MRSGSSRPLSRLGAEAIVARVVHRLKAKCGLGRYQPVGETPGFVRAIAAVIAELRLARLTSDAIIKVAPDLMRLTEAYEAALAEAELTDWPGVLNLATETASDRASSHRLIKLPMLLVDVPISSEADVAFLRALAAAAPDILAIVPRGDQPTLGRIRDVLHWKFENLDRAPRGKKDHVGKEGALERLQRQLFSDHATVLQAPPDNEVEVFSAPGDALTRDVASL